MNPTDPDILPWRRGHIEEFVNALRTRTIRPEEFLKGWPELHQSITKEFPDRAASQSLELLTSLRVLFFSNHTLERLQQLPSIVASTDEYGPLLLRLFEDKQRTCNWTPNSRCLELQLNYGFHRILDFGHALNIRIILGADNVAHSAVAVTQFIRDINEPRGTIPVLVIDRDATSDEFERIQSAAIERKRVIGLFSRRDFERILFRPDSIRDEVLNAAEKMLGEIESWGLKVFVEETFNIPASVRKHEREAINGAIRHISEGRAPEACRSVAILTEAVVREHLYSIISLAEANDLLVRDETSNAESSRDGLGFYIQQLRRVGRILNENEKARKLMGGLLPNALLYSKLEHVRKCRNDYIHVMREVDAFEAREFVGEVASLVGHLHGDTADLVRAIACDDPQGNKAFFTEDGEFVSQRPPLFAQPRTAVYLTRLGKRGFIHATHCCRRCGKTTNIIVEFDGRKFRCASCSNMAHCDAAWFGVFRKARKAPVMNQNKDNVIPTQGAQNKGKSIRPWLSGIAEAVALMAGPGGIALKALLKVNDGQKRAEMNAKIEELLAAQKEIKTALMSEEFDCQTTDRKAVNIVLDAVSAHLTRLSARSADLDKKMEELASAKDWPQISVTSVSAKSLSTELTLLYRSNLDLLYSDLIEAEYDISRLKRSDTPQVAVTSFIESLRGRGVDELRRLFDDLSRKNRGSAILAKVSSDLCEISNAIK